jgi:hypothetical protein
MKYARFKAGFCSRLKKGPAHRLANSLDAARDKYQNRNARQESTNLEAGAIAVGVPKFGAAKDGDARPWGEDFSQPLRLLVERARNRLWHCETHQTGISAASV